MRLQLVIIVLVFLLAPKFGATRELNGLKVGLASREITPSIHENIPLGGYGGAVRRKFPFYLISTKPYIRGFRIAEGVMDPIRAKAMYIENADNRVLFISLDLIGITKDLYQNVVDQLAQHGLSSHQIMISATHTHSGPGGLSQNPLWQAVAMDVFQKDFYHRLIKSITDIALEAIINATEAQLYSLEFPTQNLQRNRRDPKAGKINQNAKLLLARAQYGQWMGGVINYAVHGTSLGEENMLFSSDVPGAIELNLEEFLREQNGHVLLRQEPVFLFTSGASGDVSPTLDHNEFGLEFVSQFKAHWNNLYLIENNSIKTSQKEIDLGRPRITPSRCVDRYSWMPEFINVGIKKFISSKTILNQIQIGDIWFLSWPGEPSTELGLQLEQMSRIAGARSTWILALSNDHLSYFLSEEEFKQGGYEACSNFFGSQGGNKMLKAYQTIFQSK